MLNVYVLFQRLSDVQANMRTHVRVHALHEGWTGLVVKHH